MKPIKEIRGNLAFKPVVGKRAVICCSDGNALFTSTVAAIRNSADTGIEIETRNTIYKLTYSEQNELPHAV